LGCPVPAEIDLWYLDGHCISNLHFLLYQIKKFVGSQANSAGVGTGINRHLFSRKMSFFLLKTVATVTSFDPSCLCSPLKQLLTPSIHIRTPIHLPNRPNQICGQPTVNVEPNFFNYSIHPKARLSGFQMAISRTLFGSGFQMVQQSNGRDWTYLSSFQMAKQNGRYHLKAGPDFFLCLA
jgi:hypothetical protein